MGKRGQITIEYLLITIFAIGLMTSLIYFNQNFLSHNYDSIASSNLYSIGKQIILEAKSINTVGPPSWTTMDLIMPNSFVNAKVVDEVEVVLTYKVKGGLSNIILMSDVPLYSDNCTVDLNGRTTCYLPLYPGKNRIRLTSFGDYVNITKE